jgi:hypothetical protein
VAGGPGDSVWTEGAGFIYHDDGNVGIAMPSPVAALHVGYAPARPSTIFESQYGGEDGLEPL